MCRFEFHLCHHSFIRIEFLLTLIVYIIFRFTLFDCFLCLSPFVKSFCFFHKLSSFSPSFSLLRCRNHLIYVVFQVFANTICWNWLLGITLCVLIVSVKTIIIVSFGKIIDTLCFQNEVYYLKENFNTINSIFPKQK